MNRSRMIALCTVALTFGFALGTGLKITYESNAFKPYDWFDYAPIIANCYGADFSELQMLRAVDYWKARGHSIGFYEHNPPDNVCKADSDVWGFIIIRKQSFSFGNSILAMTKRITTGLTIRSATITYSPGAQNLSLINEHELGHAFGYNHVDIEGHVMHPNYHKMGPRFWIPIK